MAKNKEEIIEIFRTLGSSWDKLLGINFDKNFVSSIVKKIAEEKIELFVSSRIKHLSPADLYALLELITSGYDESFVKQEEVNLRKTDIIDDVSLNPSFSSLSLKQGNPRGRPRTKQVGSI